MRLHTEVQVEGESITIEGETAEDIQQQIPERVEGYLRVLDEQGCTRFFVSRTDYQVA